MAVDGQATLAVPINPKATPDIRSRSFADKFTMHSPPKAHAVPARGQPHARLRETLVTNGYRLAAKNAVLPRRDATAAVLLLTVFHVLAPDGASRTFLSKGRLCVSAMTGKWHFAMPA